jgi:hypothetical protein
VRSSDFRAVVEPFKNSTRTQVITRGAAQANQIMADFKGSKPRTPTKAKQTPTSCGCGELNRK